MMPQQLPFKLSPRESAILEIAKREAQPARVQEFEPITFGPWVALLGIVCLGIFAVCYMFTTKALSFYGKFR